MRFEWGASEAHQAIFLIQVVGTSPLTVKLTDIGVFRL
ncbi:hypothetical protein CKA32_006540 [Geitlerinema sp. FC II]|nr:hypothetical protein CKA32_006540 [Geitlerinema sp. FC II]